MRPKIHNLSNIPIAVVDRAVPCVWELKENPHHIRKTNHLLGVQLSFIAIAAPLVEWKEGISLPGPPPQPKYFDGLDLRENFMRLKTDREFLDFLNRVGTFSPLSQAEHLHGWQLDELIFCQETLRRFATRSPEGWRKYAQTLIEKNSKIPREILRAIELSTDHNIEFQWKGGAHRDLFGGRNVALIKTSDALSAILATIEIDHLRGAKFGACARPDCRMFFEITSRHKRKYCEQYCAHLESLRRMRSRQKSKPTKPKL